MSAAWRSLSENGGYSYDQPKHLIAEAFMGSSDEPIGETFAVRCLRRDACLLCVFHSILNTDSNPS